MYPENLHCISGLCNDKGLLTIFSGFFPSPAKDIYVRQIWEQSPQKTDIASYKCIFYEAGKVVKKVDDGKMGNDPISYTT